MKIKELEVERDGIYADYQDLGKEKLLLEEKLESRGFDPIMKKLNAMEVMERLMNKTVLFEQDKLTLNYIFTDYDGNEVDLDPGVYKNVVDFIERGLM